MSHPGHDKSSTNGLRHNGRWAWLKKAMTELTTHTELARLVGTRRAWLIANEKKAPCDAGGYNLRGWDTETALRTYEQAREGVKGAVRFFGLRSDAVPELAALDLDRVLNDAGGCIDPIAAAIWGKWPSYTEVTPSGRGLRIWWRVEPQGEPITVQTRDKRELAVYDPATGELRPQAMNFGRELYYCAVRFLIVTERPYQWYPDAPCSLATISYDELTCIAGLVREKRSPFEGEEEEAPELAPEPARQPAPEPAPKPARQPAPQPVIEPAPQTTRISAREWRRRRARIAGALESLSKQTEGNRNNATYWTAHRLRECGVNQGQAERLIMPIATRIGLPKDEVTNTVQSAYKGGK